MRAAADGPVHPGAIRRPGAATTLNTAIQDFASGANLALSMYPGLTQGAVAALLVHGSPEQKARYLPKMVEGVWTGTMNLTEPHCGTDLGLLRTKAVPNDDGSYSLTGTKIFISAGEHDLAENIVHLVLARIEGAPAGTKGISLFLVPKVLVGEDGSLGARNGVSCGSIEHKMGIHGNSTCVMNYDGATGWLVGEANRGLNAMFVMMNEARLAVGVQGSANPRPPTRMPSPTRRTAFRAGPSRVRRTPEKAADPIIVHPDIRRTLMQIRAFNEAARALVLWTALQGDILHRAEDAKERQTADDLMGLMTPVVKGVLTDRGFANAVEAQQVFGGHGYVEEWGMSQFVRDARIAMIYEGANGIQAMDLIGRKLPKDGGRAMMTFLGEVQTFLKDHGEDAGMAPFVSAARHGGERPAAGDDVADAERHGQTRPRGCGRHRLHAPPGAGGARRHVGTDRQGGARPEGRGRRHGPLGRQARHRPVLHGAYAARNGPASRPDQSRRGDDDGAEGRGLLRDRQAVPAKSVKQSRDTGRPETARRPWIAFRSARNDGASGRNVRPTPAAPGPDPRSGPPDPPGHREAHHLGARPGGGLLRVRKLAVGGRGRVDDQRACVADIGEVREQFEVRDELDAGFVATLQSECEDGAGAVRRIALRHGVILVGLQAG